MWARLWCVGSRLDQSALSAAIFERCPHLPAGVRNPFCAAPTPGTTNSMYAQKKLGSSEITNIIPGNKTFSTVYRKEEKITKSYTYLPGKKTFSSGDQ